MARITHVTLVDDIDGSHASETVFFSLDGRHYDIDLSAENAATLRTRLAPFVAAARRGTRARQPRPTRADHSPVPCQNLDATRTTCRFALQQGRR